MSRPDVFVFAERRSDHCLVIPVLNEGERIRSQLAKIASLDAGIDVVIADGGSTDGSVDHEALRALGVRALVVKQGPGRLGTQLRQAYDWALGEGYAGIVTMDGNDKDGVEAIPHFAAALAGGVDYAQGSRYAPGGAAINTPRERELAGRYIHAPLISLAAGTRLTDTTNGFRGYSRRFLTDPRVAMSRDLFDRYALLFYLSVRAGQLGMRVAELPVRRAYPADGSVPTKIAGWRGKIAMMHELAGAVAGSYHPPGSLWQRWRPAVFGVVAALLLFVSSWADLTRATTLPFLFGGLPTARLYDRDHFDWTSQMLVWNHVAIARATERPPTRLMRVENDLRAYDDRWSNRWSPTIVFPPGAMDRLTPYTSGLGFQGQIAGAAADICMPATRQTLVDADTRCINALYIATAAAGLGVVLAWVVANLGLAAGLAGLVFALFSLGLNVVLPNVYWVFALFVLPLASMCLVCWRRVPRSPLVWALVFAGLVTLFAARLLGGFEYASVYVLAAMLPPLFHAVRTRAAAAFWPAAGLTALASVVAFALTAAAMWLIPAPGAAVASAGPAPTDPLSLALRYLTYHGDNPVRDIVKLLGAGSFGAGPYLQLPAAVLLAATAWLLLRHRAWLARRGTGPAADRAAAGYALLAAATLASLSWPILMPMHFLQNTLYAPFNLAFPMFLFAAVFAGFAASRWAADRSPMTGSRP